MMASKALIYFSFILLITTGAVAATAPVVDTFVATPAAPMPGQSVTLRVTAHDPDCGAPPCTSGCGAIIRSDLVSWTDDTGRTTSPFGVQNNDASGSPWSGSISWIAPDHDGTYTIRLSLSDNGGMLCSGRQTRVTSLQISVSSVQPPVIDSFTVSPDAVAVGGTATLSVAAHDPSGRNLTYVFSADAGSVTQSSPSSTTATWTAPQVAGPITVRCAVYADSGTPALAQTTATVQLGSYLRTVTTGLRATRVAQLPDGRLAVADGADGALSVMSTSGRVSWTRSGLETPIAIAVSGSELYVAERGASRISVWSSNGTRLRELPLHASVAGQLVSGPGPGELSLTDIAAARILVLSSADGSVLRTVGDGLLKAPSGLAVSNGRLAVADAAAARVYIFDGSGAITTIIGNDTAFVRPQGLTWDAANMRLIASDSYSGELTIFGEDGTLYGTLAGFGGNEGQLVNPTDVTLLAGGILAVPTGGGELPLYQLLVTLLPVAPPSALTVADRPNDDGGAVALSWTRSTDDPGRVTAYRIERASDAGDVFDVVDSVTAGTTAFVDETAGDVCHRYRVVATDGAADAATEPSACIIARNDLPPATPGFVIASPDSPTSVTIEWAPVPAPDLRSYAIEISSPSSTPITTLTPAGITSIALGSLSPETTYLVAVRAIDSADNASANATTSFTTLSDAPPSAPSSVNATDAKSGGAIDVSWSEPSSTVAIAKYRVTCSPSVEGWESFSTETADHAAHFTGLTNNLPYRVSVTAIAASGRESDPSPAVTVTPTAAARELPLVAETSATTDAAGITASFPLGSDKRTIRFQYRTTSTGVQPLVDGVVFGAPLADSADAWLDAELQIDPKSLSGAAPHRLELRSTSFPAADARLSLRRIDLVPLPPAKLELQPFNSVADIVWTWTDARRDLSVQLKRDNVPVTCAAPQLARCRDVALENDKRHTWVVAAVSPAGWTSDSRETGGAARYDDAPPPVTDLLFETADESRRVTWTPLTAAVTRQGAAQPVVLYRLYAAGTLIGEVTAPPAMLPAEIDPRTIVVRSVDAAGRESR